MAFSAYTQENRFMEVHTPLGENAVLLQSFLGHERISELFSYQLDVLSPYDNIAFDRLLGQKVTVDMDLPDGKKRYFSGICIRVSQGARDETFTGYRLEVVPQLWLLTRSAQSRIFQNISVPDILMKVLTDIDVDFQIQGTFHPRTFCVQYRETDFSFISRLMEEEGIFYFFEHTANGHKMVVSNTSQSHPEIPERSTLIYEEIEGGTREDDRIHHWEKVQELRSGKYTLWDHAFEFPHKNLEATTTILDSVSVGTVTHKLRVGGNDSLELYDHPGECVHRFEGGGPEQIQKIFQDNRRTVDLRIQQEEAASIVIQGQSACRQLVAGHKFTLERHFNADGAYVLTGVQHAANLTGYRSGEDTAVSYSNTFTCIPLSLPFRPPSKTRRPLVQGTQTAVVVGAPGEKIYTDKYGRVKVQFHWDREGKNDAKSSCWIRVSQTWGGDNWGAMFIPHVGQEVIVSFIEGDPDRPIITGRVYNPEMMPPLGLPDNKTKSVIRDHGGNEIIMEGEAGKQQMRLFSPTHNTTLTLGNSYNLYTESDAKQVVQGNHVKQITGNATEVVQGSHDEQITGDSSSKVGGNWRQYITGKLKIDVGGDLLQFFAGATHRSFIGWVSTFIGGFKTNMIAGWKTELIGGASKSIIKGRKTEIISGTTYKIHAGEAREWRNTSTDEKTPAQRLKYGQLKAIYGQAKAQVDGAYKMQVAADLEQKANKIFNESDNATYKAYGTLSHKAATLKQEADSLLAKASDIEFKSSKCSINDGTLTIK